MHGIECKGGLDLRIDCHCHVARSFEGADWTNSDLVEAADRLGINLLCGSTPITHGMPTPDAVREANNVTLEAMGEYPDRIYGYCFINPGYLKASMEELERCILGEGMIGVKLYNQYFANEPVVFPFVEKSIEWGVPILIHAAHAMDEDTRRNQPRLSDGFHIAELARVYPEATLIEGHIGGGGDWEWSLKAIRRVPNVYLDTSGSVVDEGMIEKAVNMLSAQRVLFGTDCVMEGGVGKILGAELTDVERELVFWRNMKRLLELRKV